MVLIPVKSNGSKNLNFSIPHVQGTRGPAPEPPRFSWHGAGISKGFVVWSAQR